MHLQILINHGQVYKATSTNTGNPDKIAVKVPNVEGVDARAASVARKRYQQERGILELVRLRPHINIVSVSLGQLARHVR